MARVGPQRHKKKSWGVGISNGNKGNGLRYEDLIRDAGEVRVVTLSEHDDEILGSLQMSRIFRPEKELQHTSKHCFI